MDDLFFGLAALLGIAVLLLPVISLILLAGARSRIKRLETDHVAHEEKLAWLYGELSALKKSLDARPTRVELTQRQALDTRPAASPAPKVETTVAPKVDDAPSVAEAPTWIPGAREDGSTAPSAPAELAATVPPTAGAPPPAPPKPAEPARPLEQSVAVWFTRIGAGALLLGALYFFKYAADNEWIGPMGRVLIGAVLGAGTLVTAELLRPRTRAAFVHALLGVGLAILYVSSWASSVLYQLVPLEAAFVANTVIIGLGAALAYRHRGEAILVLVLIAGFLNPVLLSTGHDRPLALFAYLLLLTTGALFVAVHHGMRTPLILSMVGVAVLYAGWYDKYFETFDRREESGGLDLAPELLVGAYHELIARAVPLLFSGLFLLQWTLTAFRLRAKATLPAWVKPVAVLGLVFGHLAVTSLLYDHALGLGLGVVTLAVASVASLGKLEAKNLLLVPMLAVFFALAGLTTEHRDEGQTELLVLLGIWSGIYVVAFLADTSGRLGAIGAGDAKRAFAALFAFELLALFLLLPNERYLAAAIAVTFAAAVIAVIAYRSRQVGIMLTSIITSGLFVAIACVVGLEVDRGGSEHLWDPPLFAVIVAFLVAHVAAAVALAIRPLAPKASSIVAVVLPGLIFIAHGLLATSTSVPTMRALLTASVGVLDLGLAYYFVKRSPEPGARVTVLSALSLGLFATAVAFGLTGVTITVLWAALTAVGAFLTRESRSKIWVSATIALLIATLFRLIAFDVGETYEALQTYQWTRGRSGIYQLPVFFNARAYSLLGTGVAFWVAALALTRKLAPRAEAGSVVEKSLATFGAIFAILAYGLLTGLLVSEVRGSLADLPPAPPMVLDDAEFYAFWLTVDAAKAARGGLVNMSSTVVLASVALSLLGGGFMLRDAFHRYLGLALFLGTIGKLVLWDVWNLPRIYQVVVLTVVGILLLGSGFLYARLKVLFTGPATTAGLLLLSMMWPASLRAQPSAPRIEVHRYESKAPITGVQTADDHRLPVPAELYALSKSESLFQDLRIADDVEREVPYFLRPIPAVQLSAWVTPSMYDPGELEDGSYRATFALPPKTEHCQVELQLSSGTDFLRRTKIETGPSPADLTIVSKGSVVFSIASSNAAGRDLSYPRSLSAYVRITVLAEPEGQPVRIEGARFGCDTPDAIPPRLKIPLTIIKREVDTERKATVLTLDAARDGVPIDRLELEIGTPEFVRRVELSASSYQNAWPPVGGGVLYRAGGDDRPERVALSVSSMRKRYWKVTIFDQDDAPLEVTAASGSLPEWEMVFRPRAAGPQWLYVGDNNGQAPYYDLASIHARRDSDTALPVATLGTFQPNPGFGKPTARTDLPLTERYRGPIGWGLGVALLVLSGFAVRVLRRPTEPTS